MYFKSKNFSLLILGITSLICSRAMFLFFNDPEGPNLLIVTVTAVVVYFLSLKIVKLLNFTGFKKIILTILAQIIIVIIFYLCLN